jgi:hypothetical protein
MIVKSKFLYSALLFAVAIGCTNLDEDIYSNIPEEDFPQTATKPQ